MTRNRFRVTRGYDPTINVEEYTPWTWCIVDTTTNSVFSFGDGDEGWRAALGMVALLLERPQEDWVLAVNRRVFIRPARTPSPAPIQVTIGTITYQAVA